MTPHRPWSRAGVLVLAAAVFLVAGGGVAAAHVTVNPGTVTAGSYAKLTFRVPTESASASTVSLQVTLPSDHPFPSVSVMQLPGWTAKVTKTPLDPPVTEGTFKLTEAVTSISWTADDGVGIKPGEFMEFPISVGPVPDVPSMQFPASQTYSDGSVVRWDEARTAGGADPEHPAPTLTISAASGAAGTSAGGPASGAAGTAVTGTAQAGSGPTVTGTDGASQSAVTGTAVTGTASDTTSRVLGVVALVLAALALVVAAAGMRRRSAP